MKRSRWLIALMGREYWQEFFGMPDAAEWALVAKLNRIFKLGQFYRFRGMK